MPRVGIKLGKVQLIYPHTICVFVLRRCLRLLLLFFSSSSRLTAVLVNLGPTSATNLHSLAYTTYFTSPRQLFIFPTARTGLATLISARRLFALFSQCSNQIEREFLYIAIRTQNQFPFNKLSSLLSIHTSCI